MPRRRSRNPINGNNESGPRLRSYSPNPAIRAAGVTTVIAVITHQPLAGCRLSRDRAAPLRTARTAASEVHQVVACRHVFQQETGTRATRVRSGWDGASGFHRAGALFRRINSRRDVRGAPHLPDRSGLRPCDCVGPAGGKLWAFWGFREAGNGVAWAVGSRFSRRR